MKNTRVLQLTDQLVRLLCAVILLQTLYFKFGGASESVYIFETVGLGTAGRIGTGILELAASIALFFAPTRFWGAFLAFGLMFGALLSHLTVLGIVVLNDGGKLFLLALIVWLGSLYLMIRYYHHSDAEKLWIALGARRKQI